MPNAPGMAGTVPAICRGTAVRTTLALVLFAASGWLAAQPPSEPKLIIQPRRAADTLGYTNLGGGLSIDVYYLVTALDYYPAMDAGPQRFQVTMLFQVGL